MLLVVYALLNKRNALRVMRRAGDCGWLRGLCLADRSAPATVERVSVLAFRRCFGFAGSTEERVAVFARRCFFGDTAATVAVVAVFAKFSFRHQYPRFRVSGSAQDKRVKNPT